MTITKYQVINFTRGFTFGTRHSGKIEFGMRYMHLNNDPYALPLFIIRGRTEYRLCHDPLSWVPDPHGVSSEEILSLEPKIADLIHFDLWRQDGLPDMYIEHTMWYYKTFRNWSRDRASKKERAEHWLRFSRNTLLYEGGEPIPDMASANELPLLEAWLKAREPFLQSRFHSIIQKHGVEYITEEEMRKQGYEPPLQTNA
jgi:hypothetical protein